MGHGKLLRNLSWMNNHGHLEICKVWTIHYKDKNISVMTPIMMTTIIKLVTLGSKRRWDDNAKMDLKVTGWESAEWIDLEDRDKWLDLVNAVMNCRVPQNAENFLISLETTSIPRRTLLAKIIINLPDLMSLAVPNIPEILCHFFEPEGIIAFPTAGPFNTQVRGFKPGRSRQIFNGEKILSTPSFGGEVKPSVPCRRFTACKRTLECIVEVGISRQNLPVKFLADK